MACLGVALQEQKIANFSHFSRRASKTFHPQGAGISLAIRAYRFRCECEYPLQNVNTYLTSVYHLSQFQVQAALHIHICQCHITLFVTEQFSTPTNTANRAVCVPVMLSAVCARRLMRCFCSRTTCLLTAARGQPDSDLTPGHRVSNTARNTQYLRIDRQAGRDR